MSFRLEKHKIQIAKKIKSKFKKKMLSIKPVSKTPFFQKFNIFKHFSSIEPNVLQSEKDDTDVILTQILKYPLVLMRIFGLYHKKTDRLICKIYSFCLIAILWVYFGLYLTNFNRIHKLSASLFLVIMTSAWLLSVILISTILFFNQEFDSRQPQLVKELTKNLLADKKSSKIITKLTFKVAFIFSIAILLSISNSLSFCITFFVFEEVNSLENYIAPFQHLKYNTPCRIIFLGILILASFHWLLSIALFCSHCLILIDLFKSFNKEFGDFIDRHTLVSNDYIQQVESNEKIAYDKDLEVYRCWYLRLILTVGILDKFYKHIIAVIMAAYVSLICLGLYIMSDWSGNCIRGMMEVFYPLWLFVGISILFLVILSASKLNILVCIIYFKI